jgi:hypothetical protein
VFKRIVSFVDGHWQLSVLRVLWMKRGARGCRGVVVCLIAAMLLAVWLVPACSAVDSAGASGAISQAERDLSSAYVAVAEAERSGADVSALLNKLGSAGDSLSRANAAFRTGDYANASALAAECSSAVAGVAGDAARLKADADAARSDRLLFAVVVSSVGLVLLVVFGFLGWRSLRRRYFRQVLGMKPRVGGAE